MSGNLIDILDQLESVDDSDRFNSLVVFAEGGSNAAPTATAIVCPGDEEGTRECPQNTKLSEVLLVFLAREAIEVWSAWRDGRVPSDQDKFDAVMYYSQHDAYLPVDDQQHLTRPST